MVGNKVKNLKNVPASVGEVVGWLVVINVVGERVVVGWTMGVVVVVAIGWVAKKNQNVKFSLSKTETELFFFFLFFLGAQYLLLGLFEGSQKKKKKQEMKRVIEINY